jgi:hypothetical protein
VVALAGRVAAEVDVGGWVCVPCGVAFSASVWWDRTGNLDAGEWEAVGLPGGAVEVGPDVGPTVDPCCGAAVGSDDGPVVG